MEELKRQQAEDLARAASQQAQLQQEKEGVLDDFDETKEVMEDDADKELDELKAFYDVKLTAERAHTLKLRVRATHGRQRHGSPARACRTRTTC